MKIKYLLILLFTSNIILGQDIDSFLKKINYLSDENQIISYDFISKSGPVGLAEIQIGHGIIEKKSDDTLGCFHNIAVNYKDGGIQKQIYNGKYVTAVLFDKLKCLLINLDSFNFGYQLITGNVIGDYRPKSLYTKNYFNSILKNKDIEYIKIDSLFVFGRNCYQVTIKSEDNPNLKNNYNYYYFDVQTFLPIGEKSKFVYAETEFEKLFIISNIITSKNNDFDFFDYKIYKDAGFEMYYPNSKIKEKENSKDSTNTSTSEFSLEKYKGKLIVMDFWYIGCGPCYQLMPVLEKLYEEYPDVAFIGINPFNKSEKIKKFVKIRKLKYPVFSVPGYEKKYNITGFPVVLIFDKNGNIIKRLEGYSDSHYDEIKKEIQENILK